MNWYKKAQINKVSLSRLSKPDMEDISKDRIKLWNYLKTHNIKQTLYHGTSKYFLDNIEQSGYMMSPEAMGGKKNEKRDKGLDQVFYTSSIEYALEYSKRAYEQTHSSPVLLQLEIPLHLIHEISNAILHSNKYLYNEFNAPQIFRRILRENLNEKGIADIINSNIFKSKIRPNEFTTNLMLPKKYILRKIILGPDMKINEKTDKSDLEAVLDKNPLAFKMVSDKYSNDPMIVQQAKQFYGKEHPMVVERYLPKTILNMPEISQIRKEKWVEIIKRNILENHSYVPWDIQKEPEVRESYKEGWYNAYNLDPIKADQRLNLNSNLRKDPDIQKIRREKWIEGFLIDPYEYERFFPREFLKDPEVMKARREGWAKLYNTLPDAINDEYSPQDLLNDPIFLQLANISNFNQKEVKDELV